jgi:hypothetical protein
MAYRVEDDEVRAIIDTDINELNVFIESANTVINSTLSAEIADGSLSAGVLKQMELWLSAHFVAVRQGAPKIEKAGDGATTYFGKDGTGLSSTPYGQQALALDTTGKLAGSSGKSAKIQTIDFLA